MHVNGISNMGDPLWKAELGRVIRQCSDSQSLYRLTEGRDLRVQIESLALDDGRRLWFDCLFDADGWGLESPDGIAACFRHAHGTVD